MYGGPPMIGPPSRPPFDSEGEVDMGPMMGPNDCMIVRRYMSAAEFREAQRQGLRYPATAFWGTGGCAPCLGNLPRQGRAPGGAGALALARHRRAPNPGGWCM